MKAISGYYEWFWLMAMNIKPVENRPWSLFRHFTPAGIPARVYLHASRTPAPADEIAFIRSLLSPEQTEQFNRVQWESGRGRLFATIEVYGQLDLKTNGAADYFSKDEDRDALELFESPWLFGPYGFCVRKGEFLEKPISYRGQLGFFEVTLP